MDKTPLVSILLQSYNHAHYITECIESVFNQTFNDFELIIFDDGSDDDSIIIINELSKKYSFVFHHHQNIGLVNTIIKMLPFIRGKYFVLLSSDDVFPKNKLELQVNYMENNPECQISGGQALIVDEYSAKINDNRFYDNKYCQIDFIDIFTGKKNICSPTLMIKTDLISKLEIFNPNYIIEDLYMLLIITDAGYLIHVLDEVLCYYRRHKENSHLNYSLIYHETIKILDLYSDYENYDLAKRHWGEGIFSTMTIYHKIEAIKIIPQVFNFKLKFLIRLFKLGMPPLIWKVIKGKDRD